MREHPIIFNSESVRAIQDNRKTQTRRVIEPQPKIVTEDGVQFWEWRKGKTKASWSLGSTPRLCALQGMLERARYQIGDRLWVREGYQIDEGDLDTHRVYGKYLSDNTSFDRPLDLREFGLWFNRKFRYRKTSGRFMYKSLARLWREITDIRVGRVQDITPADCELEGLELTKHPNLQLGRYVRICKDFESPWDSINAKRGSSWKSNPWVWVIEFKLLTEN